MNLEKTVKFLLEYNYQNKGYVCFSDLYVVVLAESDAQLRSVLNNSLLTLPDGKPVEFYARLKGCKEISTVSGYWLMKQLLKTNLRHFFYGVDESMLQRIYANIKEEYPQAQIAGLKAPPMITLQDIANNSIIEKDISIINDTRPDIIWVGISSPKQDILMAAYSDSLERGIMIGIGGVFDYLSLKHRISPEWIKKTGFRWLYRLIQEPSRLWRKYLFTITRILSIIWKGSFDSPKKNRRRQEHEKST